MHQFDPSLNDQFGNILMQGDITDVTLTEQPPFGLPNRVIDPTEEFTLHIAWEVFGLLVPLWLRRHGIADRWRVEVFAESLGAGPEIRIGHAELDRTQTTPVPDDEDKPFNTKWEVEVTVPPHTLEEGDPRRDMPERPRTQTSGLYKLAVSVFLDSRIGRAGYDLVGFYEGPVIQVENPV